MALNLVIMHMTVTHFDSVIKVSVMETPTRAEPVAQEDKTKLLKAAFLQFCRYVNKWLPSCLLSSENLTHAGHKYKEFVFSEQFLKIVLCVQY